MKSTSLIAFTILVITTSGSASCLLAQNETRLVKESFTDQVDPTLIAAKYKLHKLGSICLGGKKVGVYLYEAVFGEAGRMTRRLVFIGNNNNFLGMYGNFSESIRRVENGRIYFEPDSAYKNENYIEITGDRLPTVRRHQKLTPWRHES